MRVPFRLRRLARRARRVLEPLVPDRRLAVHYFDGTDNFGDVLNRPLVAHLSGRRVRPETNRVDSDLAAIGSILHYFVGPHRPDGKRLHIWGSGFIRPPEEEHPTFARPVEVHAVRGTLTRDLVAELTGRAMDHVVLGDPGLLVRNLFPAPAAPRHPVAVLPHYADRDSAAFAALRRRHPDLHVIDVTAGPAIVAREIASCERLLSSAMHGLIAADSYGVPNQQILLSDKLTGGDFKFRDYRSAFGLTPDPWDLREALPTEADLLSVDGGVPADAVDRACADLREAFPRALTADG